MLARVSGLLQEPARGRFVDLVRVLRVLLLVLGGREANSESGGQERVRPRLGDWVELFVPVSHQLDGAAA